MDMRERLLEAVRKHGDFDDDALRVIYERGSDADWPGFTDFVDTWAFYHKHHEPIWALLRERAQEQGRTPIEVIATFDCAEDIDCGYKFKKAMACFALSEVVAYFVSRDVATRVD